MADFDEEEEEEVQQQQQSSTQSSQFTSPPPLEPASASPSSAAAAAAAGGVKQEQKEGGDQQDMDEEEDDDDEDEEDDVEVKDLDLEEAANGSSSAEPVGPTFTASSSLSSISSLLHSPQLHLHLAILDHFQYGTPLPKDGGEAAAAASQQAFQAAISSAAASTPPSPPSAPVGHTPPPVNKEREYPYIVASNELSFEIDTHIASLHKYARDLYATRYSELEQLLTNPVEYARVALLIGNESDMQRITKLLQGVPNVPNNVLLTISVTATTTRGKPLVDEDLHRLYAVCHTILQLDYAKKRMHAYISSRMSMIAPNVSAMLGTDLTAQLVALAGGLKKLSEMPACNLQNLGKKGKTVSGMSRITQGVHDGLIVTARVIQDTPPTLRQRAMRLLAGKVTLAARLDSYLAEDLTADATSADAHGQRGQELLAEVTAKIEKWQEPPPTKTTKALPLPLQKSKPRRGGKRYRKEKERMAMSEMAKQKNRMFFGKEEITDEYTGEGMGMIGQEGSGVLRIQAKDAKLSKRLSQKLQKRLQKNHMAGGLAGLGNPGGAVTSLASISGTASSIAFTPAQGMQLVKTEVAQRVGKADTYFSSTAGFQKIKKEGGAAADAKKPPLPPVPTFSAAAASAARVGTDRAPPPDAKRQRIA